jgi:hypothetical protein
MGGKTSLLVYHTTSTRVDTRWKSGQRTLNARFLGYYEATAMRLKSGRIPVFHKDIEMIFDDALFS